MMEMKVKNGVFYLLDAGDAKWIYDVESDAVNALKKLVSGKGLDPEKLSILEVNTDEENWQIKPMPWLKMAVELINEGRKQ